MANTFLDVTLPTALSRMAARVNVETALVNNCFTKYSEDYAGYGDKVQTELPQYFEAEDFNGVSVTNKDIKVVPVEIQMNHLPTIDVAITSKQMTLNVDDFNKTIMDPMTESIKTFIDKTGFKEIYKQIYNTTGTPGTPPSTFASFMNAGLFLDKYGAPMADRVAVIESKAKTSMVTNQTNGLLNVFNQSVTEQLLKTGKLINLAGTDIFVSNNIPSHTAGNVNTGQTIQVNSNVAEDATTISLKGFTASTGSLKAGDSFSIAGVYSMNFANRESTGLLQNFVVQADATANSSGVLTVTVQPRVVSSASTSLYSQYISVSSLPVTNQIVTILTAGAANAQASFQNCMWHKNAIAMVTAPLQPPIGGAKSYSVGGGSVSPIQLRATMFYDIASKTNKLSVDALFGFKVVSPWFASRLQG